MKSKLALLLLLVVSFLTGYTQNNNQYKAFRIIPLMSRECTYAWSLIQLKQEYGNMKDWFKLRFVVKNDSLILTDYSRKWDIDSLPAIVYLGNLICKPTFNDTIVDSTLTKKGYALSDSIISSGFLALIEDNPSKKQICYYRANIDLGWGDDKLLVYIYNKNEVAFYIGPCLILFKN